MNNNNTISAFPLFAMFPDEISARGYLESRRWRDGVKCPVCACGDRIGIRKDGYYRCNACKADFTVRTGTVMERSHVGLHRWIAAVQVLMREPDVSSARLAEMIGISQKSAWFLRTRLANSGKRLTYRNLIK